MKEKEEFIPFHDSISVVQIGDEVTFENGTEVIAMFGDIEISANQDGLNTVRSIQGVLTRIEQVINYKIQQKTV